jgi:PAS domain S-box-containing protein
MSLLIGVASCRHQHRQRPVFERIQKSEEKYRELVETANSAILRVNGEGRITYVNDFAQRLFGYGEKELLGAEAAGFILPADGSGAGSLPEFISAMSRDPLGPVVGESKTALRSGKTVWIAWAYRPIHDDRGLFQEMLCIGNDITELKHAEQERKELQFQLQRAQKMEAIGTLAGGVAHDLNNILSGIVSYPELLLLDIAEDSPLRKPILTIKKSGERAAAIVQDLLTLARRGVETTAVVDVNQIVTDYLASPEFSKLKLDHPTVATELHLDDQLLNIVGSPAHLSKTIMNLVVNAAEALTDGGTIVIRTENRYLERLTIGYNEVVRGDFVILVVSDTGIGIPAEDMERIFEPFYTNKAMGRSGTGLGMAVVWGTVGPSRPHRHQEPGRKGHRRHPLLPATRQACAGTNACRWMRSKAGRGRSGRGRHQGAARDRRRDPGQAGIFGSDRGQRRGRTGAPSPSAGGPGGARHDHGTGDRRARNLPAHPRPAARAEDRHRQRLFRIRAGPGGPAHGGRRVRKKAVSAGNLRPGDQSRAGQTLTTS